MPLDFPNSPTINQIFPGPNGSFAWDGAKWAPAGVGAPPWLPLTGGTVTGPTTFASSLTLSGSLIWAGQTATGFGTNIGQVPLFSSQGGVPALQTSNQLMINRSANVAANGADLWIRHAGAVSGGALTNINKGLMVDYSVPTADSNLNWAALSKITQASTSGGQAVAAYAQAWKTAGTGLTTAFVSEASDQSGNKSSLSGQLTSQEMDLGGTDVDDGANNQRFGGVGVRQLVHAVFSQPSATVNSEYTMGLWFGTQTNGSAAAYVDSLLGVQGNTTPTMIRNFLDSRGAIAPPGVTDPVAVVRMSSGHIIDFNGGSSLSSAPGNYLQYTTTGANRLRYMVGATEWLSISDAGATTMTGLLTATAGVDVTGGGISLGNQLAASTSDLSAHIALFGTTFGFSITSSRLNYNVGAPNAHKFITGGVDRVTIDNTGMTVNAGAMTLSADPTTALQAATKQYVDNHAQATYWANVKTFGAAGNGTTDDTAAIRAAIASLPTTLGGVVYFPSGTYLISSTIVIPTTALLNAMLGSITLLGDGKTLSVITYAGTAASMVTVTVPAGTVGWNFVCRNLGFSATSSSYNAWHIHVQNIQGFEFLNCAIWDTNPNTAAIGGLYHLQTTPIPSDGGAFYLRVQDSWLLGSTLVLDGCTDSWVVGNVLQATAISATPGGRQASLQMTGDASGNIKIVNNHIYSAPTGGGIFSNATTSSINYVEGNMFDTSWSAAAYGINVSVAAELWVISGNRFNSVPDYAIIVTDMFNSVICNNSFIDCSGTAGAVSTILFERNSTGCVNNAIYGNVFRYDNSRSPLLYAIYETSGSSSVNQYAMNMVNGVGYNTQPVFISVGDGSATVMLMDLVNSPQGTLVAYQGTGATGGSAATFTVTSPAADADIVLTPKGQGHIGLGVPQSPTAGAAAGYVVFNIDGTLYKVAIFSM